MNYFMTQTKILISGATGNIGTQLVKRLATSNTPFGALVRNRVHGIPLSCRCISDC
jgi:short-subunit dehydrogenase